MPLSCGAKLGPYEILDPIGAGGMGEVYKARDPRLDRTIALKVSKAEFTERFTREARTVAQLNHPNICTLHDVGPNYLVMEYVEGTPLKGPLPVERAVEYAGQILDALEAAHRKDITHRDLKPANILVTKHGIKLLDFGLAKQETGLAPNDLTVQALTMQGQITGTLQYMSPEQLQGKEADARSDLFAFGCVLYEMLSGRQAFTGSSPASIIAAVLEREPAPLTTTPPLDRIIRTCLTKDPDQRFQTARDLKRDLAWAMEEQPTANHPKSRFASWMTAAAAALGILAGAAFVHFRQPAVVERALRVSLTPENGWLISSGNAAGGLALSPDGRYAAYVASAGGKTALWLRQLDGSGSKPLQGTEGAAEPFWSPDNKSLGFFAAGKLRRVDISGEGATGSATQILCDAPNEAGAAWGADGTIVFGNFFAGLSRVSASGGTPAPVSSLDTRLAEDAHLRPQMLPGGKLLYFARSSRTGDSGVYAASLTKPNERVRLLETRSAAIYAWPGYLLWARGSTLVAQPFSETTLKVTGAAEPVTGPVSFNINNGRFRVSVSDTGLLLYDSAVANTQLTWLDRTGKSLGFAADAGDTFMARLSPDGMRAAISRQDADRIDIWVRDWARGIDTRFTFTPGIHLFPAWSPDGQSILYSGGSPINLFRNQTGGTASEVRLTESPNTQRLSDWSRDGRFAIYSESAADTKQDLWILPVAEPNAEPNAKPKPYLRTPFNEEYGRFSPEPSPRWVAYQSDETGQYEIYIQAFPDPHGKIQVSSGGGQFPLWGPGANELYYLAPDSNSLMVVTLKPGKEKPGNDTITPSAPRVLFRLPALSGLLSDYPYDVDSTGQRFLVLAAPPDKAAPLNLIVNWQALLKKGTAR